MPLTCIFSVARSCTCPSLEPQRSPSALADSVTYPDLNKSVTYSHSDDSRPGDTCTMNASEHHRRRYHDDATRILTRRVQLWQLYSARRWPRRCEVRSDVTPFLYAALHRGPDWLMSTPNVFLQYGDVLPVRQIVINSSTVSKLSVLSRSLKGCAINSNLHHPFTVWILFKMFTMFQCFGLTNYYDTFSLPS